MLFHSAVAEHGLGVSTDAVRYLSTAASLLQGDGFVQFDGEPFLLWPPLYPMMVALLAALVDVSVAQAALIWNVLAVAAGIVLTGLLLERLLDCDWLVLPGTILVALSYPLVQAFVVAQTEPLFVVLVLAFALALVIGLEKGSRGMILLASIVAALAILLRYAGVALVAAGVAAILAAHPGCLRRRLRAASLIPAVALPLPCFWVLRNATVQGSPFGHRLESTRGLADNTADVVGTLIAWFVGQHPAREHADPWALAILACVVLLGIAAVVGSVSRRLAARRPVLVILISIVVLYVVFMATSSSVTHYSRLNHRFLVPIYIPLFLVLVGGAVAVVEMLWQRGWSRRAVSILVSLAGVAWVIVHQVPRIDRTIAKARTGTLRGFNSSAWETSALLEWAPALRGERVFTNIEEALWLHARVSASELIVRPEHPDFARSPIIDEEGLVVWFRRHDGRSPIPRGEVSDITRIAAGLVIEPYLEFTDGVVYRVRTKHGQPGSPRIASAGPDE